jgi:hypothetical protein
VTPSNATAFFKELFSEGISSGKETEDVPQPASRKQLSMITE